MKLKPAITGPGPLYPTLMALAGAVPSGEASNRCQVGASLPHLLKTGAKPNLHPGTPGGE